MFLADPAPSRPAGGTASAGAAISALDQELAKLGRGEARLRLRVGELLDALFESSGHHELGFSSMDAYVVERCQRSARWGRETRGLARRIRERSLCAVRAGLRSGRISWCMGEVLVRRATPETERALVAQAERTTVRAMHAKTGGPSSHVVEERLGPSLRRLERTVAAHEIAMLELSRMLVDYLSGGRASDEALMTALLGEAETTLQSLREAGVGGAKVPELDRDWVEAMLERLQARPRAPESEPRPWEMARCQADSQVSTVQDSPLPETARGLDAELRLACQALARRNLRLGELAHRLLAGRGWRRLGYASAAEYAREHVGLSLSSLEHRATLHRHVLRYPVLGRAVAAGELGYEAALLIGRVLGRRGTEVLAAAWVARAGLRTYKHLREEVDAVLISLSLSRDASRAPPAAEFLEEVAELERGVQTGALFRSLLGSGAAGPQTFVTLVPHPDRSDERHPMVLRLPDELYLHLLAVEAQFREVAGLRASFVAFLCGCLWSTWFPYLEAREDKWGEVYTRDRHRCANPVCRRRDITPHHVVFQAHGGSDEAENVVTLCSWCHLEGVHRGRIQVEGTASRLEWTIGARPVVRVVGRRRMGAVQGSENRSSLPAC